MSRHVLHSLCSALVGVGLASSSIAQQGAPDGEWPTYGGDLGHTRYSALAQITADNFNDLELAWRFRTENLGPGPEFVFQSTPLMVDGVIYTTAGTRRAAIALDAVTGEILWLHRLNEGERGASAPRRLSGRGLTYWDDGANGVIFYVTPGYRLIALDAQTGRRQANFGENGVIDLKLELDQELDPVTGEIGLHAAPIIANGVIVIGAAHLAGVAPETKEKPKGHVRGYDARTGERKWIFHTVPQVGELGYDTWQNGSAEYTGNTGVWTTFSVDEELGIAYLPIEIPTGDYFGAHRPGENLFGESLVALDLETGERLWHFQFVHHPLWDYDVPAPPILVDINVDGREIKAAAQPTKQGWVYVFDRLTGNPVWDIEERRVPAGNVPGEWYSPTQPFPSKPPPFERQGFELSEIIDLTPELRTEALEIVSQYRTGPVFTPPIVRGEDGLQGTLFIANGANWPGGSYDPETGIMYLYSQSQLRLIGLTNDHDPQRSDMAYLASGGGFPLEVQGLPLIKPPWGRITAIDLNEGEIVWQVAHGETPEFVQNHPALQGVELARTGRIANAGGSSGGIGTLVTQTLVISGEGGTADGRVYGPPAPGRGAKLFAYDKGTGEELGAIGIPAMQTGSPMTYMLQGKQYLVLAVGGGSDPGQLIALTLP